MATYFIEAEGPERFEILKSLNPIFSCIRRQWREERMNCAKLKQLHIDVTKMSHSGKQADLATRSFFLPFERSKLNTRWSEVEIDREWPEYTGQLTKSYFGARAVQYFANVVGDYPFSDYKSFGVRNANDQGPEALLCDVRPLEDIGWLCNRVLEPLKASFPHIGGKLVQTVSIDDEVLLRAEVMSIICLLLSRFCSHEGLPHKYIPVILFSYAKMKVRIIQAYFEKGRLKIQKTDAIEFGKQNQIEELKTLLCWMLCRPVGNTQWEKRIKDPIRRKHSV